MDINSSQAHQSAHLSIIVIVHKYIVNLVFTSCFVSGAHGQALRGQAVQVRGVPEAVQPQDGLAPPHVPAHRREALHLRRVRQGLHPRGPDGEARGHAQEEGGARGWRPHVTAGRPLLAFSQPLVLSYGAPPKARRLSGSKDQLALLRVPQLQPIVGSVKPPCNHALSPLLQSW